MGNRTYIETVLTEPAVDDFIEELLWAAAARYSLQSKAFTGCICVFPTDNCADPYGMAPFCGNPNIYYDAAFASPHLLIIDSIISSLDGDVTGILGNN